MVLSAPALALSGCAADTATTDAAADTPAAQPSADTAAAAANGWQTLDLHGNEVEGYDSLRALGAAADVIVEGSVIRVDGVRQVGGSGPESLELAQVVFDVHDAPAGALASRIDSEVIVEFVMPPNTTVASLEAALERTSTAVLALREKGGDEAGRFRLVNQTSLWTMDGDELVTGIDGAAVAANVAPTAPLNLDQLQRELAADAD